MRGEDEHQQKNGQKQAQAQQGPSEKVAMWDGGVGNRQISHGLSSFVAGRAGSAFVTLLPNFQFLRLPQSFVRGLCEHLGRRRRVFNGRRLVAGTTAGGEPYKKQQHHRQEQT